MQNPLDINIHWLDLSTYGLTPGGLPKWRVVWADSRKTTIYHDGERYNFGLYEDQPNVLKHWILEKWLDPSILTGMNQDQYYEFLAKRDYERPAISGEQVDEICKLFGISQEAAADILGSQLQSRIPIAEYPVGGDYELVLILDSVDPAKIRSLIEQLEHRIRTMTLEQRKQEVRDEHAASVQAKKEAKQTAIREIFDADVQPEKTGVIYG